MPLAPPRADMPFAIFVVEDHPVMREVYADLITSEPDLVLHGAATSIEEALDTLVATDAAGCDLILTDYRLPGRSGVELVREAGVRWPGLPVLVISAHEEDAFEREARDAGAAAFLPKRNLFRNLVPAIRAALAPRSRRIRRADGPAGGAGIVWGRRVVRPAPSTRPLRRVDLWPTRPSPTFSSTTTATSTLRR